MGRRILATIILTASAASAVVFTSCGEEEGAVGIYKTSAFTGEWLLMGSLHGWLDDYDVCLDIIDFLHQEEPGRYDCRYL